MTSRSVHHVRHVRRVAETAFVLRFERHGLEFTPGQHVVLGVRGSPAMREYSVYSGISDDFLEVLVREIPGGVVSPLLARCRPGDELSVEGPHGLFVTDPAERSRSKYLFVGSGVGMAPFRSFVRSYPDLDYLLLHGVRSLADRFDFQEFDRSRYVACASRVPGADHPGRVTDWLSRHPIDLSWQCYLCGNSDMITDAFAILRRGGVPRERLHSEVYF